MFVAGCGGATPSPESATGLPAAEGGGDVVPAPPPVELLSLVTPGSDLAFFVRVDLVRGSAVAPMIEGMLREEAMFETLAPTGGDPIQDVDRLLVAGREAGHDPDVVAFEHRWSEEQVVEVYRRSSQVPEGTELQIREMGRFRVIGVPTARMQLVILSPTLAALSPEEALANVLARAEQPGTDAGETGQRLRGLSALVPDMAPNGALWVSATNTDHSSDWGRELGRLGLPSPAWAAAIVTLDDGATGYGRAGWQSEADAQVAEGAVHAVLTNGLHPFALMLRLMGLARALEASQIVRDGAEVTLRTHLTAAEVQRVLTRLQSGP